MENGTHTQVDKLNRTYRTTVVVPLTTTLSAAKLPTTVEIKRVPGNQLIEPSVVLCHQVRVLDIGKLRRFCGQLPASEMEEITNKVGQVAGPHAARFLIQPTHTLAASRSGHGREPSSLLWLGNCGRVFGQTDAAAKDSELASRRI
jgi:mRNA-degrading endonuclease toxin of MazEF toxin-antitoxin module